MSSDLNKKSVSAVKWAAAGTIAKFALQLLTQVMLARLLGPSNYGLFALGMLVLALSNFLADFGFSWGLVQNQSLSDEDVRFAFTWQVLSGALATLGLVLLAPMIADYFNEPKLTPIVRWLSLACMLTAVTAPGTNLLRRKLDFRRLNVIQIVSYVIGYLVVGLPLALAGHGVWTLVSASLTQSLCALAMTWYWAPHSVRPLFWYPGAKNSTSIGFTVFATNLCNWFLNNLDRLLLGRFLNPHAVGLYTVGYNLANTPNSLFLTALQPAFLATGAKLQDDLGRLREAYLSILATIWIVIGPLFVLLAMVSDDLIGLLYGSAWGASGAVLATLALAMPAYISWGMSTPILWNTQGKHLESLLQLPILALAAVVLYHYSAEGPATVAWIAAGMLWARALVIGACACLRLTVGWRELAPLLSRGMCCWLLAGAGAWLGMHASHTLTSAHLPAVLLGGLSGGAALLLAVGLLPRLLGKRVVGMLNRFSPPIPAPVNRYLMSKC